MNKNKQKCFDVELCDNAIFDSIPVIRSKQKSEQNNTPMKNQYEDIKRYYPDDIVLFQRGNFFQAYNDDAHFIRRYIDVQWKIPNELIGLSEVSVLEHVLMLIMQTDRKIVFCEQSTFQKTSNSLLDRFVTGIYSRGLLGFGILGENIKNIESNYLVSLFQNEAIVIDTINKVGYRTQADNLQLIKITEIITNEKVKINCLKNKAKGKSAYEQLENFFKDRHIDGLSQISFVDNLFPFQSFCLISDNSLSQLLFKPLLKPVTKEGQRKLQQLLKRIPLDGIIDRQNIITDFRNHKEFRESFIAELKRIGSLQHQMARVFNAPRDKLILKNFLTNIKYLIMQLKQKVYINKQNYKSNYLQHLKELNSDFIQQIQDQFLWEGENLEEIVPNNQGRNEYNKIIESLENICDQSFNEFQYIKQFYKGKETQITFKNFEIEMPEDFKAPDILQFSNQRKGYRKYTTTTLQKLQQQQIQELDQLKKFLFLFYNQIINYIIQQREKFQGIIDQISELDVYMAMSKYLEEEEMKCKPQLSEYQGILIEDFNHPLIENCIPNSLEIQKCIILTGYNGAGKSTILRSIGLNIVLATLGCDVQCKKLIFKPFNEIHCRMGAYDSLRESTFYIELQEVRNMLDKQNSLLLIDELGRGTSSIDGHSLAYAILKYLLKQESIILFTTHFDITLNQDVYYMEDYKLQKGQILSNLTSKLL